MNTNGSRIARVIAGTLAIMLAASSLGPSTAFADTGMQDNDKVDPLILEQLSSNGVTNVFVKMSSDADLSAAEELSDREERLNFVHNELTQHATRSQRLVRAFLTRRGFHFAPFWINNSLYVYDADAALVWDLAGREDVAYLRGDHDVPLILPQPDSAAPDTVLTVEWNIAKINADDVWASGNTGQGIVVANIDTGVRYTHEALVEQYRGNEGNDSFSHDYNWWDPEMNLPAPQDEAGHGSHTMGTMVGGDGLGAFPEDIGVAPGAQWIAAKGCGQVFCSDFQLISSAQWIACPTRVDGSDPDCSQAPHVVNNSWGGGGGDRWYQSYVHSWLMAGIAPVFAIGNAGPGCRTAGSPGDYNLVAGIGATDINDVLASFSSRGPGSFRPVKPDFVAPGEAVRSSINTDDAAYAVFSGTSMAAPHVSGTIALMLSANSETVLIDLYLGLQSTAVTDLGAPPARDMCGGRSYDVYPNFIYGWGRIDAAAAVAEVTS